jgi:hypothetical protein
LFPAVWLDCASPDDAAGGTGGESGASTRAGEPRCVLLLQLGAASEISALAVVCCSTVLQSLASIKSFQRYTLDIKQKEVALEEGKKEKEEREDGTKPEEGRRGLASRLSSVFLGDVGSFG